MIVNKVSYILKHEGFSSLYIRPYRMLIQYINSFLVILFSLFPIKRNKVILESHGDYSDNVRTLYDYLQTIHDDKFEVVWLVQNPREYSPKTRTKFVSRNINRIQLRGSYHIATGGFFVFSHPYWLKRWRKGQIVVHTTHSVAQLKADGVFDGKRPYNYILSCSDYRSKLLADYYQDSNKKHILCIGFPRIDLMFKHKSCVHMLVPEYDNQKVILGMETFKQTSTWDDGGDKDVFAINVIHSIDKLIEFDKYLTAHNLIYIIKIHHLQDVSVLKMVSLKSIIYLKDDDLRKQDIQINELLENADVLLTDYSSVFYEFLLTNRPIGFLIGDINDYKRGFAMDNPLDEMPGAKISTYDDLINFIECCLNGQDDFSDERRRIRDKVFKYQDGNNSYRLYKWMVRKAHLEE